VNRGILIEGVGCMIGAVFGGGTSMTTYSENIGAIGITKVHATFRI
jgi:nucleobase transporter 1/2